MRPEVKCRCKLRQLTYTIVNNGVPINFNCSSYRKYGRSVWKPYLYQDKNEEDVDVDVDDSNHSTIYIWTGEVCR